jgi:hypothetical protein
MKRKEACVKQTVTQVRWLAEVSLMQKTFPMFEPFADQGQIGFAGVLTGRSGRVYRINLRSSPAGYPAQAPKIIIDPRVGPNWNPNGTLCVNRPWRPGRDTFAQQVLYAADYLQAHG